MGEAKASPINLESEKVVMTQTFNARRKQEQKQFSVMLRDREAHAMALKLQKTLTDDMPFGSVTIGEAVAYALQFTLENRK